MVREHTKKMRTFWLLEQRGKDGVPEYAYMNGEHNILFSTDHNDAIQFCRYSDALSGQYLLRKLDTMYWDLKPVEHAEHE